LTSLCREPYHETTAKIPLSEGLVIHVDNSGWELLFLGDCVLIMSDVVPVGLLFLALMISTSMDMVTNVTLMFEQMLQQLS
jgi:hypothetical protein